MRLAPPVRTTARNPVLDAALASKRAADEACLQLAVDAMHDGDEQRAARDHLAWLADHELTGGEG